MVTSNNNTSHSGDNRLRESCSKGTVLFRQTPDKILRLSAIDGASWINRLPRNQKRKNNDTVMSAIAKKFLTTKQHIMSTSLAAQAIAMTIEVVMDVQYDFVDMIASKVRQKSAENSTVLEYNSEEEEDLVTEAWTLVQSQIKWNEWTQLYHEIRTRVIIFHVPLVHQSFANTTIFQLSKKELCTVCEILREVKKYTGSPDAHALSIVLQDCSTVPYAVLTDIPFTAKEKYFSSLHSCLPNLTVDWNPQSNDFEVIALYDLEKGEEMNFSFVDSTSSVGERASALKERYGPAFQCKCRKCCPDEAIELWAMERLGHVALQEGKLDDAKVWYQRSLEKNKNLGHIWHALGAISLQRKRFIEAQEIWRDAASKYDQAKRDTGISLQLEKQKAYMYFHTSKESHHSSDNENNQTILPRLDLPSYIDCFSSALCFVTNDAAISSEECQQVIGWAEESDKEWTTSRHYAVPTNDVPVHRVPKLLDWFMKLMNSKVSPLLAKQFGLSPRHFYVHDAFVVRYEANLEHNHLPLHYDESTHSFVLTLNDNECFEGGGTYFSDYRKVINPKQGTLVSFRGDRLKHGGNIVSKGVRYILAVFLYYDSGEPDHQKKRPKLKGLLESSKKSRFSFGFSLPNAK